MVQCTYCHREMKEADGCDPVPFRFVGDDKEYMPIKYGDEASEW